MNPFSKMAAAAATALVLAAAPASADTISFDFTASGGTVASSGLTLTRTYTSGGVSVTVSGWSVGKGTNDTFTQAFPGFYSGNGLGVCSASEGVNCGSPQHQIDNSGTYDFLLLQFDPAVTIGSVTVRTTNGADTDVTYYYGNANNPLSLVGKKLTELASVGLPYSGYDNDGGTSNAVTINQGIYNSLLIGAKIGESNDGFKLKSLVIDYEVEIPTNPTDIPEPFTLALFGTGLFGLGLASRRRRQA